MPYVNNQWAHNQWTLFARGPKAGSIVEKSNLADVGTKLFNKGGFGLHAKS